MSKNALLSVYDKNGIVEFAEGLIDLGWTIWASGGTAKKLSENNIEVKDVAGLVGGSAILGHKVVTLSREIHAGLLADYSDEETKELAELKIPRIDLVCGDLYPLKEEIAKDGSTRESVIAQTDMGGPAMLRSAAKGRRVVISKASQRQTVLNWLKAEKPDEDKFITELVATAEAVVAGYALASANYQSGGIYDGEITKVVATAAYGENPWQKRAALFSNNSNDPLAITRFKQIEGVAPSYNNYADFDRLLQTITHIAAGFEVNTGKVPAIAVGGKHGNACGASVHDDPAEALKSMLEGDLRAIFGGVVMTSFEITDDLAEIVLLHEVKKGKRLLDAVIAPNITADAQELLKRKKDKCRLLVNPALGSLNKDSLDKAFRTRYVRGGKLVQENYTYIIDLKQAGADEFDKSLQQDLLLAWAVGSTSNSNTISLVNDSKLIGNGVGQQDRVGAAELAVKRARDANHKIEGAVAYSDSFFPFADGPLALIEAGVKTILATSGSVADASVAESVRQAGGQILTIPDAESRGFYAH